MGYIKCCVPNCKDSSLYRKHRLPNPKKELKRFNIWLNAIKNKSLNVLDPEYIYKVKQVCHKHFIERDFSKGSKRLHLNAIPRLYLPGK